MNTEKQTGRLIGLLLLLGILLGIGNNFGLTSSIYTDLGWLQTGAQMPLSFTFSVLMGLVGSGIMMTVAILAYPILRQKTPSLALTYVVLSAIIMATTAMEMSTFLSMRTLSLQFAKHPGIDPVMFEVLRSMVGGNRNWIHYIDKLIGGASMFVFFLALFRSNLVPRMLPAFGMVAAPIQMTGITLVLFMLPMPVMMLAPIALTILSISLTLIYRGFVKPADQLSKNGGSSNIPTFPN
jgi:hypothetical protein